MIEILLGLGSHYGLPIVYYGALAVGCFIVLGYVGMVLWSGWWIVGPLFGWSRETGWRKRAGWKR